MNHQRHLIAEGITGVAKLFGLIAGPTVLLRYLHSGDRFRSDKGPRNCLCNGILFIVFAMFISLGIKKLTGTGMSLVPLKACWVH